MSNSPIAKLGVGNRQKICLGIPAMRMCVGLRSGETGVISEDWRSLGRFWRRATDEWRCPLMRDWCAV